MKNNVIVTDCDGVLLNYVYAFERWGLKHGIKIDESKSHIWDFAHRYSIHSDRAFELIHMFNESAAAGFLPPWKNAIKYVKKLHEEHGYVFHVVTSFGTDEYAKKLRRQNLETLFGVGVFEAIVCLPIGESKREYLRRFEGTECFWVEDHPKNCDVGVELGMTGILMYQDYNADENCLGHRARDWADAYKLITGE